MMIENSELKKRVLRLLREDEEFRYAIAGLIRLEEILERLDRHEAKFVEIVERLDRHEAKFVEIVERLDRHEAKFVEIVERLDRHEAKFVEIVERLDRHEAKFVEIVERLDRHEAELVKLREDMNDGFKLVERHISALGARWGLMSEEAFREALRGLLERELGFRVEKWKVYDEFGRVFGYPSEVEVDVTVRDSKLILIEISSHIRASDVLQFKKKASLYEEKSGRKPDRLLMVTPYLDEKALEASKKLEIEVYTKV